MLPVVSRTSRRTGQGAAGSRTRRVTIAAHGRNGGPESAIPMLGRAYRGADAAMRASLARERGSLPPRSVICSTRVPLPRGGSRTKRGSSTEAHAWSRPYRTPTTSRRRTGGCRTKRGSGRASPPRRSLSLGACRATTATLERPTWRRNLYYDYFTNVLQLLTISYQFYHNY